MNTIKTSISDDNVYPDFCKLAATNDAVFTTFRSNPKYTTILEHVTRTEGDVYLKLVKNHNTNV